jgi:hypothetical protein
VTAAGPGKYFGVIRGPKAGLGLALLYHRVPGRRLVENN